MNDITKAKFFLNQRGSSLATLETFALMLASAEQRYREVKMRQKANIDIPGTWEEREVEAAVEYTILRYLKKYNHLPPNAVEVLKPDTSLERKRELAQAWYSA